MLNGRDFDLEGGPSGEKTSRYIRELPDHWCIDGRAFGGYTSALALAAVFVHSGRAAAASLSVTFVEGGVPGPLEFDVHTIRGGRAAEAVEARVSQAGRTILIASSWLADDWDGVGGRPEVALWVTIDTGGDHGDPLLHPQVGDVLHADAHLFDSPGQITGFVDTWLLSLDLGIIWQPGAHLVPSTAWRLFEGRGSVASTAVSSYGSLRARDGSLIAILTSQGLLR